jgi:hypothetical protein
VPSLKRLERFSRGRVAALAVLVAALVAGLATVVIVAGGGTQHSVEVGYQCTSSAGSIASPVKITGTTPATVAPGSFVDLTGAQFSVTIPATYVDNIIQSTGATSATGVVTTLDFNSTDAEVATVNAASTPIAFGPLGLSSGDALVVAFPSSSLTVGSWTAYDKGTMSFSAGKASFTISVTGYTATASCRPTKTVTISKTSVS